MFFLLMFTVIGTTMPYITLRSSADVSTMAVPRTDDGASSVIRLPLPLPIGNSLHSTAYVRKIDLLGC